jgi:molecular chaperone GrpE (heat shock protein)
MKPGLQGRLKAAWRALKATEVERPPDDLRTALLDREKEVAALKAEYARLQGAATADAAATTRENLKDVLKRVAPPLSQLAVMRAAAESGAPVRSEDVLKLVKALETALSRAGLETVGGVGEEMAFSTRLHQRMSGGDVRDGDQVCVEFPGYRMGEDVLLKALVTREAGT